MKKVLITSVGMMMAALPVLAEDWPQYAGPARSNCSAATGLARNWPAGGPKVLWTVKAGGPGIGGYGGAAIQGGKVYILDRPDQRNDVLRVFDLATGKEEWNYSYAAPGTVSHDGSRSTPAVDDKFIITVGCFGEVHCFDKATQKPIWQKHLLKDYGGGRLPMWGISQSALLYKDDQVILAPQSSSVGVVALERATGKELWRSKPVGELHYVSPLVTAIDGVEQVIIVNGDGVSAVDASNGEVLWNYHGWHCRITIPNVTPIGDGRIFITAGYKAGCAMIKVAKSGTGWTATELFKNDNCNSQMSPAILYQGHLYANSNSNESSDGLVCMDLAGNVKWRTGKKPNFQRGHMILADGMIFIIDGVAGSLHLWEPNPQGYKELAKVEGLLGGKEIWAPLALSGGRLIIRDEDQMKCLDVAGK